MGFPYWGPPTTWTVIPKGFRDRSHFFVKALARDLEDYSVMDGRSGGTILQCVDLVYSPTWNQAIQYTIQTLNYLTTRGYRISRTKAQ